jgi:hypothetical protein
MPRIVHCAKKVIHLLNQHLAVGHVSAGVGPGRRTDVTSWPLWAETNCMRRCRTGARRATPSNLRPFPAVKAIRTHVPLYSSSTRPSQQDSLLYTQFSRTHPSSISSSIHYIYCRTHLSLYLNISMCHLVLKDLLRRI